jgi:hypothetical protein
MVSVFRCPKTGKKTRHCSLIIAAKESAHNSSSSSGQEPDGTDEYQANSPHEVEIEPAS